MTKLTQRERGDALRDDSPLIIAIIPIQRHLPNLPPTSLVKHNMPLNTIYTLPPYIISILIDSSSLTYSYYSSPLTCSSPTPPLHSPKPRDAIFSIHKCIISYPIDMTRLRPPTHPIKLPWKPSTRPTDPRHPLTSSSPTRTSTICTWLRQHPKSPPSSAYTDTSPSFKCLSLRKIKYYLEVALRLQ